MKILEAFEQKLKEGSFTPEDRGEFMRQVLALKKEWVKKDFIIKRLTEGRKITENFLTKTVEELEGKNAELSETINELERVNGKLVEINKELEQFAFMISHDLQEPVRTILSFSDLLVQTRRDELDEKTKIYLDLISQSSYRMRNQIKAILDYSRIGKTGSKSKIDCNHIVDDVMLDLSSTIEEKGASILKDKMPCIFGYRDELRSLFQNLLSNSLKYSKDEIAPNIQIKCQSVEKFWQFSVKDNGIGFKPEYKDRIFVIFQRLQNKKNMHGSGIGLSRCKKIVELHEGKIWADSQPNVGSTFYFTLPKVEGRKIRF